MALPTCKAGARRVIEELAADHWCLAPHIRTVGLWLAHQATVGLRDGRTASKTYDVDFVGGHGSFASITVHAGKWNRVEEGKVRLEGRFVGTPGGLRIFQPKARREAERGWHFAHLAPDDSPVGRD